MANLQDNKALKMLGVISPQAAARQKSKGKEEKQNNQHDHDNEHDIYKNGLPLPNTYEPTSSDDNNNLLLSPLTDEPFTMKAKSTMTTSPHPPPQLIQSYVPKTPKSSYNIANDDDDDDDEELKSPKSPEYGTSNNFINKKLISMMNELKLPAHTRPNILHLGKKQKLTMIQQWSIQQKNNPSQKINTFNPSVPLIPLTGKKISAPIMQDRKKQKSSKKRSGHTASRSAVKLPSIMTNGTNGTQFKFKKANNQLIRPKSHMQSQSASVLPEMIEAAQSAVEEQQSQQSQQAQDSPALTPIQPPQQRASMPPPVPFAIKQQYLNGANNNKMSLVEEKHDDDDDWEYYDDEFADNEYEYYNDDRKQEKEEKQQNMTLPAPAKNRKSRNVKVKLKIGSEVEVYSNSRKKWIGGKIIKIKGKLICIAYGKGYSTHKWLEASSKGFRPKFPKSLANLMKKSKSYNDVPDLPLSAEEINKISKKKRFSANQQSLKKKTKKYSINSVNSTKSINNEFDELKRVRQSIAFKQKKQVKVKLRIGSPVEVYSVSKNKWVDGKLTGIKKNLLRVAYGKGYTTEKWLRSDSKQFRPKLEMVESAIHKTGSKNKKMSSVSNKSGSRARSDSNYSLGSDDEHDVNNQPQQPRTPSEQPPPPPEPPSGPAGGAYITHSLRREAYQQESIAAIKGTNERRGDLKVKIHGALKLRTNGNFAQLQVAEHNLKTKKVSSDENPVWKEILTFSNFRPHVGKVGVIAVGNKSAIMGEKIIGTAEFELPIVFNRQEKMTIDLADKNDKLSGLVVLEQCVVECGH